MLLEEIKKDWLDARKARQSDKAVLLSTLYSEALSIGKDDGNRLTTDAEVVARVKKFIKGVDEILDISELTNRLSIRKIKQSTLEKEWLSVYLPKQLTEGELGLRIADIIATQKIDSMKKMGLVMKELNQRCSGQFDGKVASDIVRELLSK